MSSANTLKAAQSDTSQQTSTLPVGAVEEPCPLVEKSWIEIKLVGMDDIGVPDVAYRIVAADGQEFLGKTDANGWARASPIVPGPCTVSFQELDEDVWTRR